MITIRTCAQILKDERESKLFADLNNHLVTLDDSAFITRGLSISAHILSPVGNSARHQVTVFTKINSTIVGHIISEYPKATVSPQLNIQADLDEFIIEFDAELSSCAFERS